ncbi:hypothetical protein ALC57_11670 [Trachymyrmex cornetzi]|uniref:Retrovirus-related Pol polyprotein from transposon TNT 1-94-like beta-barrel domain-containing protein n=1 Tax=Trachymyrmex cornetzi TaxID=471704 RepID=A0A151J275_9HYME|nr:hypothetical protein ALC57_11670 [Trachymyrmex cornetzi]
MVSQARKVPKWHFKLQSRFLIKITTISENNTTVSLADGSSVGTAGIGNGSLVCRISNNRLQTIELKNVLYIPQLNGGLISVRKITEQGYQVTFKENTCHIDQGHRAVARIDFDGNLFKLRTTKGEVSTRMASGTTCIHQ